MRKKFENYELLLGQIITYYQLIEYDLKVVYLIIYNKKFNDNIKFKQLRFNGLGDVINELEKLDNFDNKPFFVASDYALLKSLAKKRNDYCHKSVINFAYIKDFEKSEEFLNAFKELYNDTKVLNYYQNEIEKIRIKLVKRNNFIN